MVGKYVHNSNVDANKSWIKSRERFQIARQTSFYDAASYLSRDTHFSHSDQR